VNPWQLPIQKPHPPIWIPGLISPETVVWCAEHRYPYVALCTNLEPTIEMSNLYADTAARMGYQAGPENFGYLQNVFVAETEERASELAHGFVYGGGFGSFARAEWMFPPGYNSKEATRRLAKQFTDPRTGAEILHFTPGEVDVQKIKANIEKNYQSSRDLGLIIAGTPKTVINRLRYLLETLRPGILAFWYHHGARSAGTVRAKAGDPAAAGVGQARRRGELSAVSGGGQLGRITGGAVRASDRDEASPAAKSIHYRTA
jgi:alkanesulfonate monooxygenase SsuD/methylene tetrahydromethanopterin reductase-like flavin-dependent oxidoreductase (luciferase family)